MVPVCPLRALWVNQDIQMNIENQQDKTRKNKIILILLAAFFALPYLVVFIYQVICFLLFTRSQRWQQMNLMS